MKRSEMIEKLKDIFSKYENPQGLAEKALHVVESNRMAPPTFMKELGPSDKFGSDFMVSTPIYGEWEPENEN